jgi:hypothetical protein
MCGTHILSEGYNRLVGVGRVDRLLKCSIVGAHHWPGRYGINPCCATKANRLLPINVDNKRQD